MPITPASFRPFALLREASEASLVDVSARAERRVFAEGDVLWRMGDPPTVAHFIVRGLVQVVKRLPNGAETTFGLFGPTECAGILAVLGAGAVYPADAMAASHDVEVLRVPATVLKEVLFADPVVARAANAVLVNHAQLLRAKIDVLTAGSVAQRLATLLLHLGERFGDESADGELFIPVVLSRRTLARLVGAREETVIRVMTKWDRAGLVATDTNGFAVRKQDELVRLIESDEHPQ